MKTFILFLLLWTLPVFSKTVYQIKSMQNSKCIGLQSDSRSDWAQAVTTSCADRASRKWIKSSNHLFFQLKNEASNKCLDLKNGGTNSGNSIIQYSCHSGANMYWKIIPNFRGGIMIKNRKSKLCLTIAGNQVIQKKCRRSRNQLWRMVKVKSSGGDGKEIDPPKVDDDDKGKKIDPPKVDDNTSTNFKGCATGKENIASLNLRMEKEVLRLANIERRKAGVPSLKWDNNLARAARYHAADMATENYFSHNSQDRNGGQLKVSCNTFKRIRAFSNNAGAENIAAGSSTAKAVINQWMNSTGHRKNMLSKSYKYLGVGYYRKNGSKWGNYWVQNFGW